MLEQKKLDEERMQTEQNERELQAKLDTATQAVSELESKLEEYKSFVKNPIKELLPLEELEVVFKYYFVRIDVYAYLLSRNAVLFMQIIPKVKKICW